VLLVLLALAFDFHERFPRCRELDRDRGIHRRAQALAGGAVGRVLQRARVGVFHLSVAATVGKGIIDPSFVDNRVIFGALVGAIAGTDHLVLRHSVELFARADRRHDRRRAAKAGTAPLLGRASSRRVVHLHLAAARHGFGALIMLSCRGCVSARHRSASIAGSGAAAGFVARLQHGHGGNDAQKTMGIIWLLLIANGVTTKDHLPTGW
jgi:PiT family inorganic phosphate transporter